MPIRILSETVAAQIAAGEVVERPASVVKELLENALDAGAGTISIEVREGGRRLIRLSDDGCGIPAEQVQIAFQRHSTSKLSSAADLAAMVRALDFGRYPNPIGVSSLWSNAGLSIRLIKNWLVALSTCGVRAIERVPLTLGTSVRAPFFIGARGVFLVID